MRKLFEILFLSFIYINGYCQCEDNKVVFMDSQSSKIDTIQTNSIFILNNGKDTILLEELHNMAFTRLINNPYGELVIDSLSSDTITSARNDTITYCIFCNRKDIKIVDSIDINQDGVKELILFRKWYCSSVPKFSKSGISLEHDFGIGSQQQDYSQYEVWDVKRKAKIFEVRNTFEVGITLSVSVGRNYGYRFEVNIDEDGTFYLSNLNQSGNIIRSNLEMGKYKFNYRAGKYIKQ